MSKNVMLVILILGVWIFILGYLKLGKMPKKEFKPDDITEATVTEEDVKTDVDLQAEPQEVQPLNDGTRHMYGYTH